MGSATSTVQEAVDHLNASGERTGLLKVRLYRPWDAEAFRAAVPESVKDITVLDRTREDGAVGMPLFLDVSASYALAAGEARKNIVGGQYGLASKEFTPKHVMATFENLKAKQPKHNFVVGINDDVTHTSLPVGAEVDTIPPGTKQCLFWGLGTDGTVGANKAAIKTISSNTDLFGQGHFAYDSHKGGGVTMSHIRFGPSPHMPEYEIQQGADYIACGNTSYVTKFDMIKSSRPGGTFLLNTPWVGEELEKLLPPKMKQTIAERGLEFYTIDATRVAKEAGLGQRINTVMQSAFYHLSDVLPGGSGIELLKEDIIKMYSKKGPAVVAMNHRAVDESVSQLVKIDVPAVWATAYNDAQQDAAGSATVLDYGSGVPTKHVPTDATNGIAAPVLSDLNSKEFKGRVPFDDPKIFAREIMEPVLALEGDDLPVSAFTPGGYMPSATTQFEKRAIAPEVPVWIADKCTQCNYCSVVCPHGVVRPFLFDREGQANKPEGMVMKKAQGGAELAGLSYSINLATMDCTGCAVCVESCPDDALYMADFNEAAPQEVSNWEYALAASVKTNPADKYTVKGSQFETPLLEFSGACAGCGETPYVKMLTQLFGSRMMIANASGCSSVWGGTSTTNPYTVDQTGRGPAWGRSLFEDNAEFGLGMALASVQRRDALQVKVRAALAGEAELSAPVRDLFTEWIEKFDDAQACDVIYRSLEPMLKQEASSSPLLESIYHSRSMLTKNSQWIIGGDGWAYDIGFGGLDHVLARGENVNIVVLDTEMYSNTGGQVSKSTPQSALVKFATSGKSQAKKDLGQYAMGYENVYVASCAMGADYAQTVNAFKEAEAYEGTSLLLCYSPCIDWGIDMAKMMEIQKMAVDCGYWPLYRYNPANATNGENPFALDSKRIKSSLASYLQNENRYASLRRTNVERADLLQGAFATSVGKRMESMQRKAMDEEELLDLLKARVGEATGEKVLVLYASETGNTADLAKSLAYELKRRDQRVSVMAMDDLDVNDLPNQKVVISLAATCGQGEFPANSRAFREQLSDEALPSDFLQGVRFATFAMGDSGYVFYNSVGQFFNKRFSELGATPIQDIGLGDDQDEDKWETAWVDWAPALYDELELPPPPQEMLPAQNTVAIEPAATADHSKVKQLFIMPRDTAGPSTLVPIETQRPLTPGGRDVRHYEFNISGTGLSYDAGDALAIFSTNGADRVDEFLEWYGMSRDDVVSIEKGNVALPNHFTAGQLFTEHLDIFGRPKRNFIEMMGLMATAPDEKEALMNMLTKEGKDELRALVNDTTTTADMLQMFPSAKIPIEYLLDFVPVIKPRLYSIASASEMHPDHIHTCIVEEDWTKADGTQRRGQSTWFLRNQTPGQQWGTVTQLNKGSGPSWAGEEPFGTVSNGPMVPCRVNPAVVHLPEDPRTPLVMVGLGTGLAPFRSFIQQRVMQKKAGHEVGDMLLYFGARYEATEYLYGDEIESYHADGILTDLKKAFSRDQEEKIYAQHRISEDPELFYDYMVNRDASFYLCGPAGNMPAQMKDASVAAIAKCGKMVRLALGCRLALHSCPCALRCRC